VRAGIEVQQTCEGRHGRIALVFLTVEPFNWSQNACSQAFFNRYL
jgi:hypothetical protein